MVGRIEIPPKDYMNQDTLLDNFNGYVLSIYKVFYKKNERHKIIWNFPNIFEIIFRPLKISN